MIKPYAMKEKESRGRKWPEDRYESVRGIYERDTDRVIHSRAFKRLAGKTQVISGRLSDHHRTRLTHSVEVAALCRSVARRLGLNEDLAACLGFCHDLGHPPLGHAGEQVFHMISARFGGTFEHNRHTLTIVDEFEEKYASFPGLNLTWEVREGIFKHSKHPDDPGDPAVQEFDPSLHPTIEAQLTDFCDEICYTFSDLDDAREGDFTRLERDILPELPDFAALYEAMATCYPSASPKLLFNESLRRAMNEAVQDFTNTTARRIAEAGVETVADARRAGFRVTAYSDGMRNRLLKYHAFLRQRYYRHPDICAVREETAPRMHQLFDLYLNSPDKLPRRYRSLIQEGRLPEWKVILHYMAGFTDYFLFQTLESFHL